MLFRSRIHVVKPFTPAKSWEYVVTVDHGMQNPTAALLMCIDYDGNIYIIDEYYSPGIVSEHAKAINKMTSDYEIMHWVIDPSTSAKTREKDGKPWSVLEEYEDYGLYFSLANNHVLAGINRVKEFLKLDPKRRHFQTGEVGAPRLYIFSSCINLRDEIVQYQWKKMRTLTARNAPEKPRDFQDHACDALRYGIMTRFPVPTRRPFGDEIVTSLQRQKVNSFTQKLPNITKSGMLGAFESQLGGLGVDFKGEI